MVLGDPAGHPLPVIAAPADPPARSHGPARPQTGDGVDAREPLACESRSGLVWRGILGTTSLLLGMPLVLASVFTVVGVLAARDAQLGLIPPAIALFLIGFVEITAGARVLKGSASPHMAYIVGFVLQVLGTIVLFGVLLGSDASIDADELVIASLFILAPSLYPLVRMILFFLPSTGSTIGSRDLPSGATLRAVPFVLWCPAVTLLVSPVYLLAVLAAVPLSVSAWMGGNSLGFAAAMTAIALTVMVVLICMFVSVGGLLRSKRWSLVLGGIAGLLCALTGLALCVILAIALVETRRFDFDDLGASIMVGFVVTSLTVPGLAWFFGAIKFGFKLPPYLLTDPPAEGPKPTLMQRIMAA